MGNRQWTDIFMAGLSDRISSSAWKRKNYLHFQNLKLKQCRQVDVDDDDDIELTEPFLELT